MSSPARPDWPATRIALWLAAVLVVGAVFGKNFIAAFRPPPGVLTDFIQEWLSGRNYLAGESIYADQVESLRRHTGLVPTRREEMLPRNAHPPVAVLVALPFVHLSYPSAQLAWNIVSCVLFVLALVVAIRELRLPFRIWSLLPTITLLLLCHPLYEQIIQGQFDFILLFLITLALAADRRGLQAWAGVCIGVAAAVKLFPAFLFLYFLAARRWRAIVSGLLVVVALNLVALSVLESEAYREYFLVVVPGLSRFQSIWWNASPTGFWLRLFDPNPAAGVIPVIRSPELAQGLTWLTRAIVVGIVGYVCTRAKTRGECDKAFAVAIVGMCLVLPLLWTHYALLLLIPVALLWRDLRPGLARYSFAFILLCLWIPQRVITKLLLPAKFELPLYDNRGPLLDPANNLLVISIPVYLFIAMFALVLYVPPAEEQIQTREPQHESP